MRSRARQFGVAITRLKTRRCCHVSRGWWRSARTYGYRRITALLNREMAAEGLALVNHKRVYRIMAKNSLLLAHRHSKRPGHVHDGKVVAIRSNLRWCSDGFEFTCWNGEVIRAAFILDTHDREAIAWRAVAGAGISGSDVRDNEAWNATGPNDMPNAGGGRETLRRLSGTGADRDAQR